MLNPGKAGDQTNFLSGLAGGILISLCSMQVNTHYLGHFVSFRKTLHKVIYTISSTLILVSSSTAPPSEFDALLLPGIKRADKGR